MGVDGSLGRKPVRWAAVTLATVVLLGLSVARGQGTGSDQALAESLFREGKALMDAGRTGEACPKFAESMRVSPSVGAGLNLARCHELEGRTASAWAEYQQAMTMARAAGQLDRAHVATQGVARLEPKLSRLTIEISAEAPEQVVLHDGRVVGKPSLGVPLAVDPREHTVESRAPGRKPFSVSIVIGPDGDRQTVVVPRLEPVGAAAAVAATPPVVPARAESSVPQDDTSADGGGGETSHWVAAIAASTVGIAGLVVGTAFGLSAKSKWSDAQSHCHDEADGLYHCDATGGELADDARSFAAISTAGFVDGAVCIATATVLWLTLPTDGESPAVVAPVVSDQGVVLVLRGSF